MGQWEMGEAKGSTEQKAPPEGVQIQVSKTVSLPTTNATMIKFGPRPACGLKYFQSPITLPFPGAGALTPEAPCPATNGCLKLNHMTYI